MSEILRKMPAISLVAVLGLGASACGGSSSPSREKPTNPSSPKKVRVNIGQHFHTNYHPDGTREIILYGVNNHDISEDFASVQNVFEFCESGVLYSQTEGNRSGEASTVVRTDTQAINACRDNKLTPSDFSAEK